MCGITERDRRKPSRNGARHDSDRAVVRATWVACGQRRAAACRMASKAGRRPYLRRAGAMFTDWRTYARSASLAGRRGHHRCALPTVTACQRSQSVGAVNRCGYPVEARADVVTDTSVGWSRIEPEQRVNIVDVSETATQLYVDVRRSENAEPLHLVVDVADLPEPPEGVDDDVEIVLEGDRCPSPAS